MAGQNWEEIYGPPGHGEYQPGQTLIYTQDNSIENGEILYVAGTNPQTGEPDLTYIVSPAVEGFPRPVWPKQVISAL